MRHHPFVMPSRRHRVVLTVLLLSASSASAASGNDRLGTVLTQAATAERSSTTAYGAASIAAGGGVVSAAFLTKSEGGTRVMVLGAGAGIVLGGAWMLLFARGPAERLLASYEADRASGLSTDVTLRRWESAARDARTGRLAGGVLMTVVGATVGVLGGFVAARSEEPAVRGLGVAGMIGGALLAPWGLSVALSPSPLETAHATWTVSQVSPVVGQGVFGAAVAGTFF